VVEALLVVAIVLAALAVHRLGELLRRHVGDDAAYAYFEARLEDRIRTSFKETARSVHEETAASLARLGDSVLEQITRNRVVFEQGLEVLATQVVNASRISGQKLDAIVRRPTQDTRGTREALVETLGSLHRSHEETLREIRELHEHAVRDLRRPVRNAIAIRQEIRQAREEQRAKRRGEPSGRSEASAAARTDEAP